MTARVVAKDAARSKAARRPGAGLGALVGPFGPDLWALRGRFLLANSITLLAVAANALSPWPLKWIVDALVARSGTSAVPVPAWAPLAPDSLVLALGLVSVVLAIVVALAESGDGFVSAQIKERLSYRIRDRVVAHLQSLPPTIKMKHRSGELVLRLVGDVDHFTRLWTKTLPVLVRHAVTTVVIVVGIAWLSPMVGVACLVALPCLAWLVRYHGRQVSHASRGKRKREGDVAATAQEIVRGLPVIQALGATEAVRRRFGTVSAASLAAGVQASRAAARLERSFELARGCATAAVTAGGAYFVLYGWMTLGELTVLLAYVTQLVRPIDKINDLTEAVSRGLVAGERLVALLSEQPLVADAPGAHVVSRATGHLELRDVWFNYPTDAASRAPVLRGVNLTCVPGTLTVLVGPSGAGKSTILSLLVRLFDPARGVVLLDGRPLASIALRSLRAQFAVMTQDLHLFSGSLREALTVDTPEIAEERIWEALSLVALDAFVRGLPARLDSAIGEDGLNLSGGQRQRLSLARAFLLDRPILVLDEPLANVDAASARVIVTALDRLRANRTCLAITHESSLPQHADVVYRLSHGVIKREVPRARLATAVGVVG